MTAKKNSSVSSLSRVWDDGIDELESCSDKELVEACKKEGGDLSVVASKTRKQLLAALSCAGKRIYAAACEESAKQRVDGNVTLGLPESPTERRTLLLALLEKQPEIGESITLQNREFNSLSDDEVQMYLEQLAELGVDIFDEEKE